MIDKIITYDQELFLWLNQLGSQSFDGLWYGITYKYTWIPLYLFFIVYAVKTSVKSKGWWLVLGAILVVTLADLTSVHAFKNVFERLRPCHDPEIRDWVRVVKGCGGLYGFVSSHAANSFGVAFFFFHTVFKSKPWKWMLLIWAAIVAYSRIYVGVHYPLDILCGAILGWVCAQLVLFSMKKIPFTRDLV